MPVILVNNTATVEINVSAALKHTLQKGSFDIVLENTGLDAGMVIINMRTNSVTEKFIKLDWRDISSPAVTSAEELRDMLESWNIQIVKAQIYDAENNAVSIEERKHMPTGKAMNVQIGPGDLLSNVPVVIEVEHHQVHEGETYKALNKQNTLGTNTVKYAIITGKSDDLAKTPHMKFSLYVYDGIIEVILYKSATYSGGTPLVINNRNLNSSNVPLASIKVGVTSTDGSIIDDLFYGSTKSGSEQRGATEWVLAPESVYRVDLIGLVSGTKSIIHFDWYEDTGI